MGIDAETPKDTSRGVNSEDIPTAQDHSPRVGTADPDRFGVTAEAKKELISDLEKNEIRPRFKNLRERVEKQESKFELRVSELEGRVKRAEDSNISEAAIKNKIREEAVIPINRAVTRVGIAVGGFSTIISLVYRSILLFSMSVVATAFLIYSYRNSPMYKSQ